MYGLFSVQCTVCIEQYIQTTVYNAQCTMCSVHCTENVYRARLYSEPARHRYMYVRMYTEKILTSNTEPNLVSGKSVTQPFRPTGPGACSVASKTESNQIFLHT